MSDRLADSIETALVVGDASEDRDEFCEYVKERDGYPVYAVRNFAFRIGCAAAVSAMCEGLGQRSMDLCPQGRHSSKRRIIVDNRVVCRFDNDIIGNDLHWFPPAALVLIADYDKGALRPETMDRIAAKFAGCEIIADWHPNRSREFYHCATALKASWDATPDHRPFIRTMGERGMLLRVDGQGFHFPAKVTAPLDPCGAGDMVLATLGAGRMLGLSWQECCEWATDNAAWVCSQWGSVAIQRTHEQWKALRPDQRVFYEENELSPERVA